MSKKFTGFVAGAAGAALLMSGATFALWSDSATAPGAEITTGNLAVEIVKEKQGKGKHQTLVPKVEWFDVSDDRTDNPHAIDVDKFRIIPGDTIAGKFGIDVALEGDNMVAELNIVGGKFNKHEFRQYMDVEYTITDRKGNDVSANGIYLASEDNSNNGTGGWWGTYPVIDLVPKDLDNKADFTVTANVTFKANTPDRVLTQASATLSGASIELQQVRDGYGYTN